MTVSGAKLFATAVLALGAGLAPPTAWAGQACTPNSLKLLTVKGTIRFVHSTVRPIYGPDGKADYSVIDTIDEYELSAERTVCGAKSLRVRFEYGDVRFVSCADNVPATVSGFVERDADGSLFLRVVSPSSLVCKAPR